VLDVGCLAERPGIVTVLSVRPFRCVGGDPTWVTFPSFNCTVVEQQQGKPFSFHKVKRKVFARVKINNRPPSRQRNVSIFNFKSETKRSLLCNRFLENYRNYSLFCEKYARDNV
jgi:hypothetical protein